MMGAELSFHDLDGDEVELEFDPGEGVWNLWDGGRVQCAIQCLNDLELSTDQELLTEDLAIAVMHARANDCPIGYVPFSAQQYSIDPRRFNVGDHADASVRDTVVHDPKGWSASKGQRQITLGLNGSLLVRSGEKPLKSIPDYSLYWNLKDNTPFFVLGETVVANIRHARMVEGVVLVCREAVRSRFSALNRRRFRLVASSAQ
jgi:hypothetical protein